MRLSDLLLRLIGVFFLLPLWLQAQSGELAPGTMAPEFSLPSQAGSTLALKALRGQWVVLYFYPKDMTSGCSLEAHNFQRDAAEYAKLHATIVGISTDSIESHQQFCSKEGLNFRLLSDKGGRVAALYGSRMPVIGMAKRHTFLIDPQGRIARIYRTVDPASHSPEVLAALKQLQGEK
jgi:peroxiredoxin Q/BCP